LHNYEIRSYTNLLGILGDRPSLWELEFRRRAASLAQTSTWAQAIWDEHLDSRDIRLAGGTTDTSVLNCPVQNPSG